MSNLPLELAQKMKLAAARTSVGLHFHPDRLDSRGKMMVKSLLESGVYQSQFESGISAGGVSAYPGGFRYQWESELFEGAYDDAEAKERPKYGALGLLSPPDGPAPRFGSCFLMLRPEVTSRCTFTYMDSHLKLAQRGTMESFDDVLSALLAECFERNFALGYGDLSVEALMERVLDAHWSPGVGSPSRNLDHYIEAQVHGEIRLDRDVSLLVADPSFRGTKIGEALEQLGCELIWHGGFEISPDDVPLNFRGPTMPEVAKAAADSAGKVHAYSLGSRARVVADDPLQTQEVKKLWHTLVKFGYWASQGGNHT